MSIANLQVVEWSPSQKCFHVQTISEMIRDNQKVFRGESITDYLPIGIFQEYSDVERFIGKAHEVLEKG